MARKLSRKQRVRMAKKLAIERARQAFRAKRDDDTRVPVDSVREVAERDVSAAVLTQPVRTSEGVADTSPVLEPAPSRQVKSTPFRARVKTRRQPVRGPVQGRMQPFRTEARGVSVSAGNATPYNALTLRRTFPGEVI